ncbi:class I SAM-dependent methyltransferase [Streptomyces chartreusis]|uniref:class I SAM-dependent methyltransferase n=1 Tax=Streptomyces chartreusis TaxID=1969 RepID=UPI0038049B62
MRKIVLSPVAAAVPLSPGFLTVSDSPSSNLQPGIPSPETPAQVPDGALVKDALLSLHRGLPRQGPGSDSTTRRLLRMAGPLPAEPRVLDAGCGTGRSALLMAREAGAYVTAVDVHQPFLDHLATEAIYRGLGNQVVVVNRSMDRLPFPDHTFDLVWAECSVYTVGLDVALRAWRRLLTPEGVLVLTEIEWTAPSPAVSVRAYWDAIYPLRTHAENTQAIEAAGYQLHNHWLLPESDWWGEYYTPLSQRVAVADPHRPGMAQAVASIQAEIALRRAYASDYNYAAYLLTPADVPHRYEE